MLATIEIVDLIDKSEHIGQMILQSDVMDEYIKRKTALLDDQEAQRLITDFQKVKDQYEEVQRFGRYHPDFSTIMKEVRSTKRDVDMNETVAAFKVAERNLQGLLDDISEIVAHSVSQQVKVPREGALMKDSGCGCGSGGGCGCQAS
ncbi:YlbF family regulator [Aquibacillus koreensis]|uniref:YlbF family regulator n=1 Tax=Aquibacillus koreensis TaxID=279446 RepID=A0A9X3WJ19_9BACI|nr:YlbF family regulator [Aquibacillus koreensis]MCT2538082.1 YlbF family regulator [Aquibacillus koreensis]MDC3420605.1 YlbF family regulator [Aquibacillus koreensis]